MNSHDWKEANGWGPNGVKTRAMIARRERDQSDRSAVFYIIVIVLPCFVIGVIALGVLIGFNLK